MTIDDLLAGGAPPIVAILRGIAPDVIDDVADAVAAAGIRLVEVPLNSPEPFASIERLQARFGTELLCGAGTVLALDQLERLAATGARLMVAPNTNATIIACAIAAGLAPMPGFATVSEALAAAAAGARHLKLFPARALGIDYLRSIGEVLPRDLRLWAVGGTDADNIAAWLAAGATGIGVGGALYRPGDPASVVGERARALVTAWRSAGARA